jgi:hypothetical protein
LVSKEAAEQWRREREQASEQPAAEMHTETAA